MKILTTSNGTEIKLYSSPKEMPIGRYSDFQKYLASEINIDSSLARAKAFAEEGKADDCITEIDNAIFSLNEQKNSVGILTYCFAVFVAEIGGKVANDTTIEGLNTTIGALQSLNITQYEIESCVEELKKK